MSSIYTRIQLAGHLTREALDKALSGSRPLTRRTPPGTDVILLDCLQMTDYDLDARHAFVAWLKETRPSKVAILTDRQLWHLVIRTMSLASGVPLMPFGDETLARGWLASSR